MGRLHGYRAYALVLGLFWVLPAVLVATLHWVLPDHNPSGQCEGIGWGCTPTPADSVLLLGFLAAPFLLVAGPLACALIFAIRYVRGPGAVRGGGDGA